MADPPQQAAGADPRRLWFAPPDGPSDRAGC